jgi:hypothetical protein
LLRLGTSFEGTLRALAGGELYEVPVSGTTTTLALPAGTTGTVKIGLSQKDGLFGYHEVDLSSL